MSSSRRLRGSDVFAAIGDPTRRKVLEREPLAAGQIAASFRVSRPAISQHLHVLHRAKLVAVQKRGRERIYRLNPEPLQDVYGWVEHYKAFWTVKMMALGKYLDGISGDER
jgi:DNA-binding transcriptional ArsR family regulator